MDDALKPTEIRFYRLTHHSILQALTQILPLAMTRYGNIMIKTDATQIARLNQNLWQSGTSFLPHASMQDAMLAKSNLPVPIDEFTQRQPILLSENADNLNHAHSLFCLDIMPIDENLPKILQQFKLICLLFPASDAELLAGARALWQYCQAEKLLSIYYHQDSDGAWHSNHASSKNSVD